MLNFINSFLQKADERKPFSNLGTQMILICFDLQLLFSEDTAIICLNADDKDLIRFLMNF